MTVNEYFTLFSHDLSATHSPLTTVTTLRRIRLYFLPLAGDMELKDVSPRLINKMYDDMAAANYAPNSIFGAYASVSLFFSAAMKDGFCYERPTTLAHPILPVRSTVPNSRCHPRLHPQFTDRIVNNLN